MLEHCLSRYGRIFSTHRGMVQGYPDVFNGLHHLRMELKSHISCFLRFRKYQVQVKYDGQPTTCRRCNSGDHLYEDCNNSICFNCDQVGHHSRMCPKTSSVVFARRKATWPSIAITLGIAVPRLLGLCLRRILRILFPPSGTSCSSH